MNTKFIFILVGILIGVGVIILGAKCLLTRREPTVVPSAMPTLTATDSHTLTPTTSGSPIVSATAALTPTPSNTRVIPIPPTFTPGPSPTPTRLPARTKAMVVGIQDSRTIEVVIEGQPLSQVFVVRLLGVEPPLLSDPWAGVAYEWLTKEVGRQVVVLESDAAERDEQGNLLRYVWKEGLMVNVAMMQRGLATTSEDAAKLNYSVDLLDAQSDARTAERGMWGPEPTSTPTPFTPTATLTTTRVLTAVLTATLAATQTPSATLESASSP